LATEAKISDYEAESLIKARASMRRKRGTGSGIDPPPNRVRRQHIRSMSDISHDVRLLLYTSTA